MSRSPAPSPSPRLEWAVFALVSTAFTHIYITQPLQPALQLHFAADTVAVAWTVSAVLLGFALANLPFGYLSDKLPIKPLVVIGALTIASAALAAAMTEALNWLIAARFVQGLFMPALTTCLAAYLARSLPRERLNVAMGSYVSATILGGMFGRLLGGWIYDPSNWRAAFVTAAVLVAAAAILALPHLPSPQPKAHDNHAETRYRELLGRWDLLPIYLCAATGQAIFSPVFNTVSYRLAESPMALSTRQASLVYLVYVVGVAMGPVAGWLSNRLNNGATLIIGAVLLGLSVLLLHFASVIAVVLALLGICVGFFSVHAAAVGALNRKLSGGQGRANALYIMFYYLGAWAGVGWSAWVYQHSGWSALVWICFALSAVPLSVGFVEHRNRHTA